MNSSSRPHLVQAKQTWFAAEPVAVHAGRQWDAGLALAAPLTATRVGAYWVDLVVRTETRGCWRSVFADYERCTPHGLLLGPRLRDIDAQDLEGATYRCGTWPPSSWPRPRRPRPGLRQPRPVMRRVPGENPAKGTVRIGFPTPSPTSIHRELHPSTAEAAASVVTGTNCHCPMPYCTPTETGHKGGDAGSHSPGTAGRTGLDEGQPDQERRLEECDRLAHVAHASMKGHPIKSGDVGIDDAGRGRGTVSMKVHPIKSGARSVGALLLTSETLKRSTEMGVARLSHSTRRAWEFAG